MKFRLLRSVRILCLIAVAAVLTSCQRSGDGREASPLPADEVAERAELVLAIADPVDRAYEMAALLQRATPEALPALREAVEAAPLDLGDPELVSFAMWWTEFAPIDAFGWVMQDWRATYVPVIEAVFEVNAYRQPETAFKMLGGVPERFRDGAIRGAMAGWQRAGSEGLLEHVEAIPDLAMRQKVSEILAQRLVLVHGAEGAMAIAEAIETPAFRSVLQKRIASAAAYQGEAATVASWATEAVTSGDERPSGLPRRIGTRWIRNDPEAAFAWLASLPAGKDRDDGVMESFRDWMMHDRAAASAWAESVERERWNEPALSIYLRQLGFEDPKKAITRLAQFEMGREIGRRLFPRRLSLQLLPVVKLAAPVSHKARTASRRVCEESSSTSPSAAPLKRRSGRPRRSTAISSRTPTRSSSPSTRTRSSPTSALPSKPLADTRRKTSRICCQRSAVMPCLRPRRSAAPRCGRPHP